MNELARLGNIDIYLFDQLVKGRIEASHRILDAGCGGGRNADYLLRMGCQVYGADISAQAVRACRRMAADLHPGLSAENFRQEAVEQLSFQDDFFDVIIASALLHFAEDEDHFQAMLRGMWRVLRPGGLFFARLASSRCIADQIQWIGPRQGRLPDGSTRFVVDDDFLQEWEGRLAAQRLEPIKTTLVENLRAMTTWVVRKPA
jgi:2-polyprenyl-3-methyl-5-hydroxy-6-metoxy-1,4-benzoquinol methylase